MPHDSHRLSAIELCPDEILLHIQEQLDLESIHAKQHALSLRLTCRRLNLFFTAFAIKRRGILLGIRESSDIRIREKSLKPSPLLSPAPEAFAPFISSLIIKIYLRCDDSHQEEVMTRLSPLWKELSRYISLRSLNVICCLPCQCLLNYLVASPLLLVNSSRPTLELVSSFSGTRSLSPTIFDDSEAKIETPIPSLLGNLLQLNPRLRSLSISCNPPHGIARVEELLPAGLYEVAIESIQFRGMLSASSQSHNPVSKPSASLRALPKISNLREIIFASGDGISERPADLAGRESLNLDLLWHQLKESGARIKKAEARLWYF
ncbi:hypothetical protein AX16_007513 [Volvariella volvacea WC 439]|nr:hypothetical protein AX16_007513 [Volvariella volvacea WC 439]